MYGKVLLLKTTLASLIEHEEVGLVPTESLLHLLTSVLVFTVLEGICVLPKENEKYQLSYKS